MPTRKTAELPPITDEDRAAAPLSVGPTVQVRLYNPDNGLVYQIQWPGSCSADRLEIELGQWLENGYLPCQSPDVPPIHRAAPIPADKGVADRVDHRPGQREYQPKEDRLILPFGKYKGTAMSAIARSDPDYIKWLADKATMPDIRKAAQKLVNLYDEEASF